MLGGAGRVDARDQSQEILWEFTIAPEPGTAIGRAAAHTSPQSHTIAP